MIYTAVSTNTILIDIQERWEKENKVNIRISAASSSSLAKQIISGAPANIYISASWEWIKEIKKLNLLNNNYIVPLFKNKLVLIAPINSPIKYMNSLNKMIKNPDFKPDALKIYPCMVMKGTELYKKYKEKTC